MQNGLTLSLTVLVLLGLCSNKPAIAQGEHARRAAAEIRVMVGDLKRLDSPELSTQHKTGLQERILGSISALDILFRLADEETAEPDTSPSAPGLPKISKLSIKKLRQAFIDDELKANNSILRQWLKLYPLALSRLEATQDTDMTIGKNLHKELCAPCHDNPARNTARPAYNLFDEANNLAVEEFIARLLTGVRGDRVTGIDNPLSDQQIQSLAAYYAFGKQP